MKTQKECWQALIDGNWLTDGQFKIRLVDGMLRHKEGGLGQFTFCNPENWQIYEPKYTLEQIENAYRVALGINVPIKNEFRELFLRTIEELEKLNAN